MTPIRFPLGSIPGIATMVVCALGADIAIHHHPTLYTVDALVRMIDDRR